MSEMNHDLLLDQDLASLPSDVQALVAQLADDGATWRASLPTTATLDAAVRTLSLSELDPSDDDTQAAVLDELPLPPVPSGPNVSAIARVYTRPARVPVRLASMASVAALVAVVTLTAGVFALQVPGLHRGRGAVEPTATPTLPPDTAWVDQSQLDVVNYSNIGANQYPVVAPSDPRVVYEAFARNADPATQNYQLVLQRTDDGGVAWHTLPNPVPGLTGKVPPAVEVVFVVSPLDAHTVILKMRLVNTPCPAPFAQFIGEQAPCQPQYRSTDGGATWVPLLTPDYHGPAKFVMGLRVPLVGYFWGDEAAVLRAQGARLYSVVSSLPGDNGDCPFLSVHIVASEDGGATWRTVDDALVAQQVHVVDYAPSPTGSSLFAVTAPGPASCFSGTELTLWRSDDVGATWQRVGLLPAPYDDGLVAVATADPSRPLLYLDAPHETGYSVDRITGQHYPFLSYLADDLKVSTDGGHTWQSAPTAGIPTGLRLFPGLPGTLSDGSIVAGYVPDFGTVPPPANEWGIGITAKATLYAWKLGDSTWRQLAPALDEGLNTLVVTAAGGQDTLWVTYTTVSTSQQSGATYIYSPTRYYVLRFRLP